MRRVVYASSHHAVGFYRRPRVIDQNVVPRPDGIYGVSKVFGEGVGRLFADKHGLSVACLRIGAFRAKPGNARELGAWISHRDMAQLARCCVQAPPFHFLVLYGISANQRAMWGGDDAARAHIGYVPQDNAEAWAGGLADKTPPAGDVAALFHGGSVCQIGHRGEVVQFGRQCWRLKI